MSKRVDCCRILLTITLDSGTRVINLRDIKRDMCLWSTPKRVSESIRQSVSQWVSQSVSESVSLSVSLRNIT